MSDDARLILDGLMARYPDADPATLAILRRLAPLLVNGDPSEIAALQRLLPPATEAKAVEAGPLAAWPPDWTQKLHPDERKLLLALFDILDTEETGGGMAPPGDLHPTWYAPAHKRFREALLETGPYIPLRAELAAAREVNREWIEHFRALERAGVVRREPSASCGTTHRLQVRRGEAWVTLDEGAALDSESPAATNATAGSGDLTKRAPQGAGEASGPSTDVLPAPTAEIIPLTEAGPCGVRTMRIRRGSPEAVTEGLRLRERQASYELPGADRDGEAG